MAALPVSSILTCRYLQEKQRRGTARLSGGSSLLGQDAGKAVYVHQSVGIGVVTQSEEFLNLGAHILFHVDLDCDFVFPPDYHRFSGTACSEQALVACRGGLPGGKPCSQDSVLISLTRCASPASSCPASSPLLWAMKTSIAIQHSRLILTDTLEKKINIRNSHINQKYLTINQKTLTIHNHQIYFFKYSSPSLQIENSLKYHCRKK